MSTCNEYWFINSDNLVQITGLKNVATDAFLNSATVTAQVKDAAGTNVGGAITFVYVAASDGDYNGSIPNATALLLTDGDPYTLEITIIDSGLKSFIKVVRTAKYKDEDD